MAKRGGVKKEEVSPVISPSENLVKSHSLMESPALSLAGLDRKTMEQERLARLRKRQRSISPPDNSRKAPKLLENHIDLPSGARLTTFSAVVDKDQAARKTTVANLATEKLKLDPEVRSVLENGLSSTATTISGGLQFPKGVVKKTWAFKHERNGDDIKIEEVLEPSTLRTAVLSAFQWNVPWVLSKLRTPDKGGSTKCVFVMQAKEQEVKDAMLRDTEEVRSFLRLCFPPMIGQTNCMHSKLMLLFHPKKLRVAIPTANLLDFDWGETGLMENSVFMIDLPRLPNSQVTEPDDLTPFGKELLFFLVKQDLDQDIRTGLLNFDFSATKDMRFIHTVGGVSYKTSCERTGLCGLGKAVRELGADAEDLELDFAASSIGSLNDEYLKSFRAAAQGEDMISRAVKGEAQAKTEFFKPATTRKAPSKHIRDVFRIYFPTHETVKASTAGAAGTICISRKYWENAKFPAKCFRDYRSLRTGLLSHNKILYARGKQRDPANGALKDIAWAYVGSANMSESAWGKLVYDKKAKEWKINCRNWECGVLLPVPATKLITKHVAKEYTGTGKAPGEESETESENSDTESETEEDAEEIVDMPSSTIVGMDVFTGLVDPPFEIPGQLYGDREPWFFME